MSMSILKFSYVFNLLVNMYCIECACGNQFLMRVCLYVVILLTSYKNFASHVGWPSVNLAFISYKNVCAEHVC
jgi:hypothetical protein